MMTTVTIELPEERVHELSERATALGITIEALIQASITDLLTRPADDVQQAIDLVLTKNAELYRRLA
jgi:predicted transcriptional regulator